MKKKQEQERGASRRSPSRSIKRAKSPATYLSIDRCPMHGFWAVSWEIGDGGGTRITPSKCCGSWETVKRHPVSAEDVVQVVSGAGADNSWTLALLVGADGCYSLSLSRFGRERFGESGRRGGGKLEPALRRAVATVPPGDELRLVVERRGPASRVLADIERGIDVAVEMAGES